MPPSRSLGPDLAVGLFVLLLGALVLWQAAAIPASPIYAQVGPKAVPFVVAGGLILLGGGLLYAALRGGWSWSLEEVQEAAPTNWRALALVLADGRLVEIFDPTLGAIGNGAVAGVPITLLVLGVLTVVVAVLVRRSAFGRRVVAIGGNASLVVQRCPTVLKGEIDVWGDVGSSLGLMRALKSQLDPHHTLNPGRYVGGI
jgi:ribose/xylose/arabinose/galactoside ABC-type transport system permease subunit